jgi:hypothetical protein
MPAQRIWVIDRSSVQCMSESSPGVFAVNGQLDRLVTAGSLGFPKAVYDELKGRDGSGGHPYVEWFRRNRGCGQFGEPDEIAIADVLRQVPAAMDYQSKHEESAPAVLAMALTILRLEEDVRIVTEDRYDKPNRVSMRTAASVLRIHIVSVQQFLGTVTPKY